jgi:hypothetical protein
LFGLSRELSKATPGQRLPDLPLNLFVSLGDMWSYQTTPFINPLPGYVESKAGDAETL